jgi:hypothetical protein
VTDSAIALVLSAVAVVSASPIPISNSDVTLVLSGANSISGGMDAAIACADQSNLTVLARAGASLAVSGYAGIATPAGGACHALEVRNGSYRIANGDGACIGTGASASLASLVIADGAFTFLNGDRAGACVGTGAAVGVGNASSLRLLLIENGTFNCSGKDGMGCIGTGLAADNGTQFLENLTVRAGTFSSTSAESALVGAGVSTRGGSQAIGSIEIFDGNFTASRGAGALIGSALQQLTGSQSLGSITIHGGDFVCDTQGGAGIGTGKAENGTQAVGSIAIAGGTFSIESTAGAGVGTGAVGKEGDGTNCVDLITITGGTFSLQTSIGAGIGTGYVILNGETRFGRIAISNGTFSMTGSYSAGVGLGYANGNIGTWGDSIVITGGNFTISSNTGAGIGTSYVISAPARVHSCEIYGGTFSILTNTGACIGTGSTTRTRAEMRRLLIAGGIFNLTAQTNAIGTGATRWESRLENVTIVDAVINIHISSGGAGIGPVYRSGFVGIPESYVNYLAIRRSRINVTLPVRGVCFGAMVGLGEESPQKAVLGDLDIEDSELFCASWQNFSTGIGTGLAAQNVSLSVGNVTLRNTTLVCDLPDGQCIGSAPGNGVSQVESVEIEGGRIVSESGQAILLRSVVLDGTQIECSAVGPSCIETDDLEVRNSLFGKTRTVRFFNTSSIHWEQEQALMVKYYIASELEGIANRKLLHLSKLNYLDDGPYSLYFHGVGASSEIEMDGSEDGVLMAVPASGVCRPMHRAKRGTHLTSGDVLTSGGDRISFGPGETLVTNPVFQRPTMCFTTSISPYAIRRGLLRLAFFAFLMIRQ